MTPSRRAGHRALIEAIQACSISDADPLETFVSLAWRHLEGTQVSWLGFYRYREPENDLVLEACRDRPACSPIGLHGVCGQAHRTGQSRIVADVAELGPSYVACDPRDRSELVIPVRRLDQPPEGRFLVLDLDSFELAAFDQEDDRLLRQALRLAGFDPIEG